MAAFLYSDDDAPAREKTNVRVNYTYVSVTVHHLLIKEHLLRGMHGLGINEVY